MANYKELMQRTVDRIVALIEEGEASGSGWERPWQTMFAATAQHNPHTGTVYRGINQFMLGFTAILAEWDDPRWSTYNGWTALGAQVRKGEHGETIIHWSQVRVCETHGTGKGNRVNSDEKCCDEQFWRPQMKSWSVFNAEQVDGAPTIELPSLITVEDRVPKLEAFIAGTGVNVADGKDRAYFRPSQPDRIHLPRFEHFKTAGGFYSTAFHELTHWTGHESRLERENSGPFGSNPYAREELIAELGSAWLMQLLGYQAEPSINAAEYLANWMRSLKAEPSILYESARDAQKAVDFLVDLVIGEEEAA